MSKWMRLGLLLVTFLFVTPIDASSSTWIKLSPTGGPPPARFGHTSVYDPTSNRLIVFAGCSNVPGSCNTFGRGAVLNDLWVLSSANGQGGTPTWTQLTPTGGPPRTRFFHVAVYDPVNNRMVIWGGDSTFGSLPDLTDVWVLTNANGLDRATGLPATPNWSQLFPIGGPPTSGVSFPGREDSTGVYDSITNRMIVFGGDACDPCTFKNDVWVLTNANGLGGTPQWLQLFPTGGPPAARVFHSAVYDAAGNRMTIFGGREPGSFLSDTWVLANASGLDRGTGMPTTPAWTQLTPTGTLPPPRYGHTAAYDAATNRMVIFGGADATSFFNDVRLLDNANGAGAGVSTWSQILPTGTAPEPRFALSRSELYDAASKRMLAFGGLGVSGAALNDSWVLTEVLPPPLPAIDAISPTSGIQGQTITNFTVSGNNFQQTSTLSFSGTGIGVNFYSSRTATQIVASVSIASNAVGGARDVIVTNPDGQRATLSAAFTVILLGQPAISVSPSPISFITPFGTTQTVPVTINNPGTATLLISSITTASPFALVGPLPTSISANNQATFGVTFSAVGPGPFLGSITIASNAPTSPTVVPLQGAVILPDLSVSDADITPLQAIKNPDIDNDPRQTIDLVLGRPTIVRVHVSISNAQVLGPTQPVQIQLTFQGSSFLKTVSVADLLSGPVDFFPTPSTVGDSTISVTIDPANLIPEVSKTNNQASQVVTVKPVRDVRYAYMEVNYLGSTPNVVRTVLNSGDYLQAVYPLAPPPDHFLNELLPLVFVPDLDSLLPNQQGALADARSLWLEGELLTLFKAERIIGIVPKRWFTYHQLGNFTEGVVFPMVREAAFVLDDRPLVTAHELGHTYGFGEGYVLRSDGTCCLSDGESTSGFWVQRMEEVTNSIDYMGDSVGAIAYPDQATLRWSTMEHFADLFRQFRTQPNDPEVLLVTGTISQNGTVALGPMYRISNGTFSQPPPGNATVQILDAMGNVVARVPFVVDFRILSDPPGTLDVAPFAFAIPYPANTFQVQIVRAGQVLAHALVATKLLHDAVASIPDVGFIRNPSELRNALQNKIDGLDAQLGVGDFPGALDKLQNDIRKHLADWLVENYPTQTARQYTKTGILELVDELLQRLGG